MARVCLLRFRVDSAAGVRLRLAAGAAGAAAHSMHCPGIGAADSQIDRGRRMTVNATLRSCAR